MSAYFRTRCSSSPCNHKYNFPIIYGRREKKRKVKALRRNNVPTTKKPTQLQHTRYRYTRPAEYPKELQKNASPDTHTLRLRTNWIASHTRKFDTEGNRSQLALGGSTYELWPVLGNRFRHATATQLREEKKTLGCYPSPTIFGCVCHIAQ